jgi:hypothetical protein
VFFSAASVNEVVVKSRNQHVKVVEVDEERKSEPVDDYLN